MAAGRSFIQSLLYRNQKNIPETVDAAQYAEAFERFKALLIEQYQRRLQTKTARRLPINLSAKPTSFGTSAARAALYFDEQTIESEDIASEVDKILNTHDRLLIIGDPGAGKTTILLFAAVNILQHQQDPKLPLIVNLATWRTDNDFADWYAQSIAHTYGLSPAFVQALLQQNAVTPFFDGFDEVSKRAREDCFQKMTTYFGDQRSRQMIVCSRKKEYAAAKADAPVYAAIEVQPLSRLQIEKALFENGQTYKGDLALFHALGLDEPLAKAVETPFYLNTASFLFAKGERTVFDFPFKASTAEGRQRELVEIFVEEQVPKELEVNYLRSIASQMHNDVYFNLASIQPLWIKNDVGHSLIFVLAFSLTLTILFNSPSGIILGIISGLLYGFGKNEIFLRKKEVWHWKTFKEDWRFILEDLYDEENLASLLGYIFLWIFISLIIQSWSGGMIGCLFGILVYVIWEAGCTPSPYEKIKGPYQTLVNTSRRAFMLICNFIFSLLLCYIVAKRNSFLTLDEKFVQDLRIDFQAVIQPFGLLFLLFFLINSQILAHFGLRLVLYLEHKLPLRLVTFLDRMSEQYIFEDNRPVVKGKKLRGATWRFRHKILQDYFRNSKVWDKL